MQNFVGTPEDATETTPVGLASVEPDRRKFALEVIVAEFVSFGITFGALALLLSNRHTYVGDQLRAMTLGAGIGALLFFLIGKLLAQYAIFMSPLFKQKWSQGLLRVVRLVRKGVRRVTGKLGTLSDRATEISDAGNPGAIQDEAGLRVSNAEVAIMAKPEATWNLLPLVELVNTKEEFLNSLEVALGDQVKCEDLARIGLLGAAWSNRGCGCVLVILFVFYGLANLLDSDSFWANLFFLAVVTVSVYSVIKLIGVLRERYSWRRRAKKAKARVVEVKQRIYEINRIIARRDEGTSHVAETDDTVAAEVV